VKTRNTPLTLLCLGLIYSHSTIAAETDSFSSRGVEVSNSVRVINKKLNRWIEEGIEAANEIATKKNNACDEKVLYQSIKNAVSKPFIGHSIAVKLSEGQELDLIEVDFEDSVYQDFRFFDGISVHLKGLIPLVKFNEHFVGLDKLGHFFVEGWEYFEKAYLDEGGISAAQDWGEKAERTYFGWLTTGIYSFADLTVNFEGMRFWLRVLGQERDPINNGFFMNRPYVRCSRYFWEKKSRWRKNRSFTLSSFLNGLWDEANNCSKYRNERIARLVEDQVTKQEEMTHEDLSCPLNPRECKKGLKLYEEFAPRLLHPSCLDWENND